jgi:hypothetical protein
MKECNLNNNTAYAGGALYISDSIVTMEKCHCNNNRASHGGVLHIINTELSLLSDIDPNNPTILEDNVAGDGAAIFANNANVTTRRGNFVFRNNMVRTVFYFLFFKHATNDV